MVCGSMWCWQFYKKWKGRTCHHMCTMLQRYWEFLVLTSPLSVFFFPRPSLTSHFHISAMCLCILGDVEFRRWCLCDRLLPGVGQQKMNVYKTLPWVTCPCWCVRFWLCESFQVAIPPHLTLMSVRHVELWISLLTSFMVHAKVFFTNNVRAVRCCLQCDGIYVHDDNKGLGKIFINLLINHRFSLLWFWLTYEWWGKLIAQYSVLS